MTPTPGARLGPYEIVALLGAGGMGMVHRARDTRLQRDIAIKLLPPGLLIDASARRRFRKEALALARLSHPNIVTVYDVGEQDGADYLVMECVPGESLATRLRSGPPPSWRCCRSGCGSLLPSRKCTSRAWSTGTRSRAPS